MHSMCAFTLLFFSSSCLSANMDDSDKGKILELERKVVMMSDLYEEVMRSKTRIEELERKVQECSCSATHKRKNTLVKRIF